MQAPQYVHILQAIKMVSPLSKEGEQLFMSIVRENEYQSGKRLLNFGQVSHRFHYVNSGSGRVFYLKNDVDVTDYIAMNGQFLGGVESLFTGQPTHKAIETTEDSVISSFLVEDFEHLCKESHELERLGRKMAIFAFLECQRRIETIRFMPAGERYEQLQVKYPGIANRIPLKHLASYLGITQVSLSRIRAGIQ